MLTLVTVALCAHALLETAVLAKPAYEIAAVAIAAGAGADPGNAARHRRVLDEPGVVDDRRPGRMRDTDTVFTMPHYETRADWEAYAENLRRRILVTSGLWPLAERGPVNAVIEPVAEHPDYIVEKVHFEAYPGYLVTGNLYRPQGEGPFPGILSPHGHWGEGRLEDSERGSVPARAITFARMGMVTFTYDMVGYVDNRQIEHNWGDERSHLWGMHPFAVQLKSAIRGLDFLESLPYVDADNLAATGASGGGTQTFIAMAVDPRIKAAAPVTMISSTMQGGCICENAPILRLDNSNMEIGALMAPRPLILVSATGDWTRETPRVEYPAIRSIYDLYGAADRVKNAHIDAGHNYNQASREAVYRFFAEWVLEDDGYAEFTEPPYEMESEDALRVFPEGESLPEDLPRDDELIEALIAWNRAQIEGRIPKSADELDDFRDQMGPALRDALHAATPHVNALEPERTGVHIEDGYVLERWIIRRPEGGEAVPALLYRSGHEAAEPQSTAILVHGEGKAALSDPAGGPGALIRELIERDYAVLTIDTLLTGEFQDEEGTVRMHEGRYTDTFLPTLTAYRVQDILTAVAFVHSRRDLGDTVALAGLGEAGLWSWLAAALEPAIERSAVDLNGFDPGSDADWVERHYVPVIRSVGGVFTATAMTAPRSLWVMNAAGDWPPDDAAIIYELAGAEGQWRYTAEIPADDALADFLME